jgi:methyltransferase (TIGR00027 family)
LVSRRNFLAWSAAAGLLPGAPSRTARGAAMQRAAHQLLETPRVFDDPLALRIFGAQGVAWLGRNLENYRNPSSRAMRAFLAARSRYAEDELARAHARGVRQYVVLGAGLDTFAFRNPYRGLRVFEVDHPSTQAWKREQLRAQSIDVPRSAVFASVDFERQTLAGGLRAAGFDARRPAFYSWLGVVIYLSPEAAASTLRSIAAGAKGSQVVFDFAPPPATLAAGERRSHDRKAARVARAGEPWVGYYSPGPLVAQLLAGGFAQARAFGAADMNERYFDGRMDGFRVHGSGHIMNAQV